MLPEMFIEKTITPTKPFRLKVVPVNVDVINTIVIWAYTRNKF